MFCHCLGEGSSEDDKAYGPHLKQKNFMYLQGMFGLDKIALSTLQQEANDKLKSSVRRFTSLKYET